MRKVIILLLVIFAVESTTAQEKILNTKIEKATIFKNGAQVTRVGNVNIGKGRTILIVDDLPPGINNESISVNGIGNFTIMSIAHNQINDKVCISEKVDVEKWEKIILAFSDSIKHEKSKLELYQGQINLLSKLDGKFNPGKEFSLSDFKEAFEFQNKKLSELKMRQLLANEKIAKAQELINDAKAKLNTIAKYRSINKKQVVVTVSATTSTIANLKVTYFITNAGWNPTYDIRVKNISKPLELVHKANVYQNTGEDWNDILLTLSSGNPNESSIKPVLNNWYLNYMITKKSSNFSALKEAKQISGIIVERKNGQPIPGANVVVHGTNIGTISDVNGCFSLIAPKGSKSLGVIFVGFRAKVIPLSRTKLKVKLVDEDVNLENVVVTGLGVSKEKKALSYLATGDIKSQGYSVGVPVKTNYQQTSVEFNIEMPYSIPSDGKKYAVQIQKLSFPTKYQYYCVPKLDKDVFLIAKITDWEKSDIATGSANLYFEGTYLGKSQLNLNGIKDTLNLSLGRDKNIKVERNMLKSKSTDQKLGNKRTDELGWEIIVKNMKKQAINILIEDQLPISDEDDIKIEPIGLDENAHRDLETEKITWNLNIPSLQETTLSLKYFIKYPSYYKISSMK